MLTLTARSRSSPIWASALMSSPAHLYDPGQRQLNSRKDSPKNVAPWRHSNLGHLLGISTDLFAWDIGSAWSSYVQSSRQACRHAIGEIDCHSSNRIFARRAECFIAHAFKGWTVCEQSPEFFCGSIYVPTQEKAVDSVF